MTKQDVIELLRIHASLHPKDKDVLDAVIDFIDLKFKQDTYNKKFERNYGSHSERREALPDGDA